MQLITCRIKVLGQFGEIIVEEYFYVPIEPGLLQVIADKSGPIWWQHLGSFTVDPNEVVAEI